MAKAIDFLETLPTKTNKSTKNVNLSDANIEWVASVSKAKGVSDSAFIDHILTTARKQHEFAMQEPA
jgi:hypothetical protein